MKGPDQRDLSVKSIHIAYSDMDTADRADQETESETERKEQDEH